VEELEGAERAVAKKKTKTVQERKRAMRRPNGLEGQGEWLVPAVSSLAMFEIGNNTHFETYQVKPCIRCQKHQWSCGFTGPTGLTCWSCLAAKAKCFTQVGRGKKADERTQRAWEQGDDLDETVKQRWVQEALKAAGQETRPGAGSQSQPKAGPSRSKVAPSRPKAGPSRSTAGPTAGPSRSRSAGPSRSQSAGPSRSGSRQPPQSEYEAGGDSDAATSSSTSSGSSSSAPLPKAASSSKSRAVPVRSALKKAGPAKGKEVEEAEADSEELETTPKADKGKGKAVQRPSSPTVEATGLRRSSRRGTITAQTAPEMPAVARGRAASRPPAASQPASRAASRAAAPSQPASRAASRRPFPVTPMEPGPHPRRHPATTPSRKRMRTPPFDPETLGDVADMSAVAALADANIAGPSQPRLDRVQAARPDELRGKSHSPSIYSVC
jgi:hypothetical protein